MKTTIVATATLLLSVSAASASESIAHQIDRIAPLVTAGELERLGGPESPSEIVSGLSGRWFTLNNTVRNWEREGGSARQMLGQSIERLCADDWENIVTFSTTGPGRFRVEQQSPTGEDKGTFDMVALGDGRTFSTVMDEDYILSIYGLEDAPAFRQQEVLREMKAIVEEGEEIWLPGPDIMVVRTAIEVEVWGRCPE
jgi:hypothetical protein